MVPRKACVTVSEALVCELERYSEAATPFGRCRGRSLLRHVLDGCPTLGAVLSVCGADVEALTRDGRGRWSRAEERELLRMASEGATDREIGAALRRTSVAVGRKRADLEGGAL